MLILSLWKTESGHPLLWASPLPMCHLHSRSETKFGRGMPTKRNWKANDSIDEIWHRAVFQPQGWVSGENEDWQDWCEVGPQVEGHPRYKQEQPPLTSLINPSVWGSSQGYSQRHEENRGAFFKCLRGIYTLAQSQVEVHREAGIWLCFHWRDITILTFATGRHCSDPTTSTKEEKCFHICIPPKEERQHVED